MAVVCTAGCTFWDRLEECATLTATVNPALEAVRVVERAGATADAYRSTARTYAALAEHLATTAYASPALVPLIEQYESLLREVAQNAESFAAALDQDNQPAQQRAQQKARQQVLRYRTVIHRLEAACRGH